MLNQLLIHRLRALLSPTGEGFLIPRLARINNLSKVKVFGDHQQVILVIQKSSHKPNKRFVGTFIL